MKNLSFNEEFHEYTLVSDDGESQVLPSVTQIASAVTGKDLSRIPAGVLAAATERGVRIHQDVESGMVATKEGAWIEGEIYREDCVFERRGYASIDGLIYAGTADIITEDGIVDIKSQGAKDILYWTIQLNLYRQFCDAPYLLRVLWTPKTGPFKVINIDTLSDGQMSEIIAAYRAGLILPSDWLLAEALEAP